MAAAAPPPPGPIVRVLRLHSLLAPRARCRRRGKRRSRARPLAPAETARIFQAESGNVRPPFSPELSKFYARRHALFWRYEEGIRLDATAWFSVTPEAVARAHARMCTSPHGLVIDAFAGSGADAIALTRTSARVLAIDIDPSRLAIARHNAAVYGVEHRIDFVCADFYELAAGALRADAVFLSPPWGGPEYLSQPEFDVERMLDPPLSVTLGAARRVAQRAVAYVPRTARREQLRALALPGERCEVHPVYVNVTNGPPRRGGRRRLLALSVLYELSSHHHHPGPLAAENEDS